MPRPFPLSPIWNPDKQTGSIKVGSTPSVPTTSLPSPVLAYESTDWSGGAAVPALGSGSTAVAGTVPNTGTAGSDYDIPIVVRNIADYFGAGDDLWTFDTAALDSSDFNTTPFSIPAGFWTDLGGGPLAVPFSFAFRLADLVVKSSTGFGFRQVQFDAYDGSSPFPALDVLAGWFSTAPGGGVGDEVQIRIGVSTSGSANDARHVLAASPGDVYSITYDADTGILTSYINGVDVTGSAYSVIDDRSLDNADRPDLTPPSFSPPDNLREGGWINGSTPDLPVKGDPFPGITEWRLYRAALTADQHVLLASSMGA